MPLAVGFGISTCEQARVISPLCDGIVVGSTLVEIIGRYGSKPQLFKRIHAFTRKMKGAINIT